MINYDLLQAKHKEKITLVDDKLGIMETNSNRLFMEIKIKRGITQKDVDEKGIAFMDYLSTFDILYGL